MNVSVTIYPQTVDKAGDVYVDVIWKLLVRH